MLENVQKQDREHSSLATYQPELFESQAFFFGSAHALAPLVVAYAPQGSPRGLPTERR